MRIIIDTRDHRSGDLRVEPVGDGTWRVYEPGDALPEQPETLEQARARVIAANRTECERRILDRYPLSRQMSASLGLYDQAFVDALAEYIAVHIQVENAAADAIEAALSIPAIEAVTVTWPT